MKRIFCFALITLAIAASAYGQRGTTITGTAVIYGTGFNTRTISRPFTMVVNGRTSAAQATQYLNTLQRGGQDDLLRELDHNDLGRFSLTGSVGQPLSAVIVDEDNGSTRIRAVFQRWIGFGELRYGLRSADYPFGYVEIRIDPQTGRGEGTIIPAARIRFRNARNGGMDQVEIEDFGTFPGRLMGVQMRGGTLR
ncbi:MAG TPA: hypothetical protein VMZ26_12840 [Pyrinomonadaceae bacterium]|nr:hypothetical protein [Pyrinomonadaceae bacterium]